MYQRVEGRFDYQQLARDMRGGVTWLGELRPLPQPAEITSTLWERVQAEDRIPGESARIVATAILAREEYGKRGFDLSQLPAVAGDMYGISIYFPQQNSPEGVQMFSVEDASVLRSLKELINRPDHEYMTVRDALAKAQGVMTKEDEAIFIAYRQTRTLIENLQQDPARPETRAAVFKMLLKIDDPLAQIPKNFDDLLRMKFMLVTALAETHTPGSELDMYTYTDGGKTHLRVVNTKAINTKDDTIALCITPSISRRDEPISVMTRQLAEVVDKNTAIEIRTNPLEY